MAAYATVYAPARPLPEAELGLRTREHVGNAAAQVTWMVLTA